MKVEIKIKDDDSLIPIHIKYEYNLIAFKLMLDNPQFLKQIIVDIEKKIESERNRTDHTENKNNIDINSYI